MKLLPLGSIVVQNRQRTSVPDKHIQELADSIAKVGLLHPPVCWWNERDSNWELVAGECRLRAIRLLHQNKAPFQCGGADVPLGDCPILDLGDELTTDLRFEAELDENLRRHELDWKDKAQALARLHELRVEQNSKQTLVDTGLELARLQGGSPDTHRQAVSDAKLVAREIAKGNTSVINARNQTEAMSLILRQEEERVRNVIARRTMAKMNGPLPVDVRKGDLVLVMPQLDAAKYDLILADPPYGIGAHEAGYRTRTVHHHNYDDTSASAQALMEVILTEGFRVTKARANLLMFFDIRHWEFLQKASKQMAWAPFPRPLIWRKSESEGMAPWGSSGPRLTTEFIFYATKGQRGMTASPTDVFEQKRVPRSERLHAAEKPVDLLKKLIEITTLPGDSVLDPCCGSGSTLIACRETLRNGLGIEKDEVYFNTAYANLHAPQGAA